MIGELDSVDSCLAADRAGIKRRVDNILGKKEETRINLYKRLLKVRKYIDANPEQSISVKKLSEIGAIAEAHLSRQFRNAFNCSPYEYLVQRRMAKARTLLKNTNILVTDLALEVGYESLGTFISTFTRESRISPKEYRRRFQK